MWNTKMLCIQKAVRANIPALSESLIDYVDRPLKLELALAKQAFHILKDNDCAPPPFNAFDGAEESRTRLCRALPFETDSLAIV